ncbi:MAG: penicillin-binding protein 2 [Desulfuromonadia bacterium]
MNRLPAKDTSTLSRRVFPLSVVVVVCFFILLSRLWYLQVIETRRLSELSENNRLRFVPVAAPRGAILDRNGKTLVGTIPSFSVAIIPQDLVNRDRVVAELARIIQMDPGEIHRKLDKFRWRAKYYPIVVASGITRDQMEYIEENRLRLPGVTIEMKPIRSYPSGNFASHLLGYISEISEDELNEERFASYNPGDYVGKNGLEKSFERHLHGRDGGRQIEVDARGRYLRTISETSPVEGESLILTIDAELQSHAERAFANQAGAAVVLDVNSGEVLAFVSSPTFDPSLFAGRMPPEVWKSYTEDKRHPLENKALKGQYPPGSTFKIVTALAALEEGIVDPRTTVTCTGSHTLGTDTFRCWNRKGHGSVDLRKALRESCDVYFYQVGEKLGIERIAAYARCFGLGNPTGVELENEKGGTVPDGGWKQKKFGKPWYRGETLPVSIGQGYVTMTPLQLAVMTAAVATDGKMYRPHLVMRIVDREGKTVREFSPELLQVPAISPPSYRAVREGLFAVVNEGGGTGAAARLVEVKVAGKTGTSQVVKQRNRQRGDIPYQYRDHALFVAFAPYDRPEIAVAVVVEHGEHGGGAAAPIAGSILRKYFELKGVIRRPPPVVDGPEDEEKEESEKVEGE